jgi:chromate reductase
MQQPEIYLNAVGDAFSEQGEIVKESIRPVLQAYIDAFAVWVDKLKK